MRVVYAPDSYGGFLGSPGACRLVRKVLALSGMDIEIHPMADGGEGSLEVLGHHGVAGRLEVIESAHWLGFDRPGMGGAWGERSSAPLAQGLKRAEGPVVVGLGGTSTMDGGAGALQALGLTLRDGSGRLLPPAVSGAELARVHRVEGRPPLRDKVVQVLLDVQSPFVEAPVLYGPQKGLTAQDVIAQRAVFRRFGEALRRWRAERGLAPVPLDLPGGGAAGGLGYALRCCGAQLVPGAERIARLTGLEERLRGANVVVVGEGRMDRTSFEGKVAQVVMRTARRHGVHRVIALVGSLREAPPPPVGPDLVIEAGEPTMEAFLAAIERLGKVLAKAP